MPLYQMISLAITVGVAAFLVAVCVLDAVFTWAIRQRNRSLQEFEQIRKALR